MEVGAGSLFVFSQEKYVRVVFRLLFLRALYENEEICVGKKIHLQYAIFVLSILTAHNGLYCM